MTTLPHDSAGQLAHLLAFMGEVGGQAEACWVTLTGPLVQPATPAAYVIGRSPLFLLANSYVNPCSRCAGAQLVRAAGGRHAIHVRVVANCASWAKPQQFPTFSPQNP